MPRTNNPLTPEQRAEIARQNGAKFRGPKTETGKAKVCRNALKHGFAADKHHVTDDEDFRAYSQLHDAYFARFAPTDPVEVDLVTRLVYAAWRLRRAIDMDASSLNIGRAQAAMDADSFFHDPGNPEIAHLGLKHSAFEVDSIHRYELRAARIFSLSMKQLAELRGNRGFSPDATPPADPPPPPPPPNTQDDNNDTTPEPPTAAPASLGSPENAAVPNKPTEHGHPITSPAPKSPGCHHSAPPANTQNASLRSYPACQQRISNFRNSRNSSGATSSR